MAVKTKERFVIDLFAGCGGLSLGLENAGFMPILVNELANEARESYLVNRKEYKHFNECKVDDPKNPWVWSDVKALRDYIDKKSPAFQRLVNDRFELSIKDGELDLLVGGPPCQGFSGIGHRRSYSVDKKHIPSNHLYEDMLFLIDKLNPKIFLFENVKGLLSARWETGCGEKGEIWRDIRKEFIKYICERYEMGWHLVRAAEYGVPQNRPRVLMVGIRRDLNWRMKSYTRDDDQLLIWDKMHRAGGLLPNPSGEPPHLQDLLSDLIDPRYKSGVLETKKYPHDAMNKVQEILRKKESGRVSVAGDELTEQDYSKHSDRIVKKFSHMINNEGKIHPDHKTKKFAQRVLPKEWVNGGPTITATSLPDDYVHFCDPRILTVREWARLQMFPDWYQFAGKRTTGGVRRAGNPREGLHDREVPKYTQIGNAVPVLLAEKIGKHFRKILDSVE